MVSLLASCAVLPVAAVDLAVTSPGFFFSIDGVPSNPTLTLTRGQTYRFIVNTDSFHPFEIVNANNTPYNDGLSANNISSGTMVFTVPMTAPDTLRYICPIHLFGGQINIVNGEPPPDFAVTSPGSFYAINGAQPNPTITLTRGVTYSFGINTAADHPFAIVSDLNTGTPYQNGVTNNNISNGNLFFHVPTNAPNTLYYICSIHLFGGQINIVDPPPPPDFQVTSPDFYFSIQGQENPTLTLTRGVNYTFAISTDPTHPFQLVSDFAGTMSYDDGVVNNNINEGTLTFTVPMNAPDLLYYICPIHLFGGMINIVDPPQPPPLVLILSIDVGSSNVVMKSRGTNGNGWVVIPEFSSNLVVSNWAVVPNFTNSFLGGTNTTTFNRLDPICGPNVFLRVRNAKP
jgi:hypothetical protein